VPPEAENVVSIEVGGGDEPEIQRSLRKSARFCGNLRVPANPGHPPRRQSLLFSRPSLAAMKVRISSAISSSFSHCSLYSVTGKRPSP